MEFLNRAHYKPIFKKIWIHPLPTFLEISLENALLVYPELGAFCA